jgi:hypothetical protein
MPANRVTGEAPAYDHPPFTLAWGDGRRPLPVKPVRAPARLAALPHGHGAPPWIHTGPAGEPFDFCAHVRALCADIVRSTEALRHVDTDRVLFGYTQARNGRAHGLQARVTPLRFRGGGLTRRQRGVNFRVQRFCVGRREMLYLMTFCLPRFLNQDFDDKFITLFHELYHIGPEFNGDLRRHGGRYSVHTHSQRLYDEEMAKMARAYLAGRPDAKLHGFLRLNFAQLWQRHGGVVGVAVPRPKLIPLAE